MASFLNGALAGCVFGKEPAKGLPAGRVVVAAEDYRLQVTNSEAPVLQSSMLTRRQKAWDIVREAFRPVAVVTDEEQASQNSGAKGNEKGQSVTVPLWTTWYSSEDFSIVYKAFLNRVEGDPSGPTWGQARTLAAVDDIMQKYRTRKIVLSQRAVSEQLRQFNHESSAERAARLQDAAVGRGVMLFSPALIRHYLLNHRRVRGCSPDSFPASARPADLEPAVRPADPANRFAMCFDGEFPREAVMIKAVWSPVYRQFRQFLTDAQSQEAFWTDPVGKGLFRRGPEDQKIAFSSESGLHFRGEDGTDWVLSGLHISTKEVPEWVWVSLWWSPDPSADFGADRPVELEQTFPFLSAYKMCVATGFKEGDPDPAGHYLAEERLKSLGESLAANARHLKGMQWCANPFLENGFAQTNCVGCHMAAGEAEPHNFPETLQALRSNGLADFLQTFNTFQFLMGGKARVNSGARSSQGGPSD